MEQPVPPRAITSLPQPAVHDRSSVRVLFVDGDCFTAALIRATLEDASIEVDWASSARSALVAARAGGYDVYLLGRPHDMCRGRLAEELAALDAGLPFVVAGHPNDVPRWLDVCVAESPFAPAALVGAVESASKRLQDAA